MAAITTAAHLLGDGAERLSGDDRVRVVEALARNAERLERLTASLRVLVVEDEPDIRLLVAIQLRTSGYEVTEAATGEEGLERLGGADVLLDVRLPGPDGFEVLVRLGRPLPVPVVMMSAHCSDEMRGRAVELGCAGWLQKPFAPEALLDVLTRALGSVPA